jgi:Uma2 family endonuclease
MSVEERLCTRADLEALYNLPENADKKFELFRGMIYEEPTGTPLHAWIISTILHLLRTYLDANPIGYAFADSIQYDLPNGDTFIPDVSFVSEQRQPELPSKFTIAPDLAIEVFSPGNREREMTEKIESYLQSGTQRVWVAYPESKVVEVYRLSPDGGLLFHTFGLDTALGGEDLLPGLQIPVRDVFPNEIHPS